MRTKRVIPLVAIGAFLVSVLTVMALDLADWPDGEIDQLWKELWKAAPLKIEKLSERQVIEQMAGKWSVNYGTSPDKLLISIQTNHLAELSGKSDNKDWKHTGQWRVVSDKLCLFIKEEKNLPGLIVRIEKRIYILDPWSTNYLSELKREK